MPNGAIDRGKNPRSLSNRDTTPTERLPTRGRKPRPPKKEKKSGSYLLSNRTSPVPIGKHKGRSVQWIADHHPEALRELLNKKLLVIHTELRKWMARRMKECG